MGAGDTAPSSAPVAALSPAVSAAFPGSGDGVPAAWAMASDKISDAREVAMPSGPSRAPLSPPGSAAVPDVSGAGRREAGPGPGPGVSSPDTDTVTDVAGSAGALSGPGPGSRVSSLDTEVVSRDPPLAGEAGGGPGETAPRSPLGAVSVAALSPPGDPGVTSAPTAGALSGQGNTAGGLTGAEMTSERRLLGRGGQRGSARGVPKHPWGVTVPACR